MGFLKKETGYAFSGFEGQLLYQGEPASGAKITRSYELFGDSGEETVTADHDGRFKFESIAVKFRAPLLAPYDFMSYQSIVVQFKGVELQVWGGMKSTKEEYSEFDGRPKKLYCELTEDSRRIDTRQGPMVSSCHWEV